MTEAQRLLAIYERALEYLDGGDGWMQNWFVAPRDRPRARDITMSHVQIGAVPAKDCKFCLAGAIGSAIPPHSDFWDSLVYAPIMKVLPGAHVGSWNDAEGRTYEEVEAVLKKAIEKLRQQVTEEGANGNLRLEGSYGRA